jgi:hypothetical protein
MSGTLRTLRHTVPGAAGATERRALVRAFWLAVALSLVLFIVPYGRLVLYPFAILTTWAHEMGHGLAALAAGGRFHSLHIFPDLGGVAYSYRPDTALAAVLVSAGGLLGPAIAGALTVIFSARAALARGVHFIFAALLVLSLVLWVRNVFGVVAVLALAAGYAAVARFGAPGLKLAVAQFTGIQLCLGSLASLDYMFTRDFERAGATQVSDTQAIAQHLPLPYWFWGGIIASLSLLILTAAWWIAWRRPVRRRRT